MWERLKLLVNITFDPFQNASAASPVADIVLPKKEDSKQFIAAAAFFLFEKPLNSSPICRLLQDTQPANNRHQGSSQEEIHWAGKTAPSRCRKEQTGSRSLQKWTPSTICKLQFYLVKSMCPHCKIYLSNLLNAFVKIAKCIYPNWWIYLSKLQLQYKVILCPASDFAMVKDSPYFVKI